MTASNLFGVVIDQDNYITGTVQSGGQLIGWEFPNAGPAWIFRRSITEFFDAIEVAGALTVKGLVGGTGLALLRWNNVPMTESQLDQLEVQERLLLVPVLPISGLGGDSLMDCRFRALRSLGYLGTTSDMLRPWLQDNGGGAIRQINDMWRTMLIAQGFTPALDYQYNDAWYAFLGDRGFTGSINDREKDFWCIGGGLTSFLVGPAFSDGFSDGFK